VIRRKKQKRKTEKTKLSNCFPVEITIRNTKFVSKVSWAKPRFKN